MAVKIAMLFYDALSCDLSMKTLIPIREQFHKVSDDCLHKGKWIIMLIFTKKYIVFYNKWHELEFYDKLKSKRRKDTMQNIIIVANRVIITMATKAASMEANTTCPLIGCQPKEPQAVKKLRKF